ncbi:FixH family protein [Polaromonas sp.]|uniref:FixH family protein n=1 Tax=Polaromonas sp. TaxID=1869339 RepID=UPI00356380FA
MQTDKSLEPGAPWWTFPLVWMVIAGPAIVVVAGFVTLWLAMRAPDPLVAEDYYRRGLEINKTLATQDKALMPAVQGRNHAATPTAEQAGR